uniref:Uncharacterized protein n=1 Tax=Candidatus Kentrum sp. LFY TaxID=2126342 RepID=A0A450UUU0_9GAMM|nr:MAG: hypothetical protein BECKLFY1418A_GA0070994_10586 [Candidatus Kentron sp. LFY]
MVFVVLRRRTTFPNAALEKAWLSTRKIADETIEKCRFECPSYSMFFRSKDVHIDFDRGRNLINYSFRIGFLSSGKMTWRNRDKNP